MRFSCESQDQASSDRRGKGLKFREAERPAFGHQRVARSSPILRGWTFLVSDICASVEAYVQKNQ